MDLHSEIKAHTNYVTPGALTAKITLNFQQRLLAGRSR
jgi:hypothetical protein